MMVSMRMQSRRWCSVPGRQLLPSTLVFIFATAVALVALLAGPPFMTKGVEASVEEEEAALIYANGNGSLVIETRAQDAALLVNGVNVLSTLGQLSASVAELQDTVNGQTSENEALSTAVSALCSSLQYALFTIYVTTRDSHLHALNPDGSLKWSLKVSETRLTDATVLPTTGMIFVGDRATYVHAIHPNGTQAWKYETEGVILGAPAVSADGRLVIVANADGNVFALNAETGEVEWTNTGPVGSFTAKPAVSDADNAIYIGSTAGHLYAFNLQTGTLKWANGSFSSGQLSPVTLSEEGHLFVATTVAYSFTSSGDLRWESVEPASSVTSTPALSPNGILYVATSSGAVVSLDPATGSLSTAYQKGGIISSSIAFSGDGGTWYVAHQSGLLEAILAQSLLLAWDYEGGGDSFGSPVVGRDGTVYFTNSDGYLRAIAPGGNLRWQFHTGAIIETTPTIAYDRTTCLLPA